MTRVEATGHYHIILNELRGAIQKRDSIVDAMRHRLQSLKSRGPTEIMDYDDNSFIHACTALNSAQKEVRDIVARINEYASIAELPSVTLTNINVIGVVSRS